MSANIEDALMALSAANLIFANVTRARPSNSTNVRQACADNIMMFVLVPGGISDSVPDTKVYGE